MLPHIPSENSGEADATRALRASERVGEAVAKAPQDADTGEAALARRVDEGAGRSGVVDPDATQQPSGGSTPEHPVALFCTRPQGRIDDAVNQGLSILAGLALGSSVSGRGQDQP